jgi:hypothetical protein
MRYLLAALILLVLVGPSEARQRYHRHHAVERHHVTHVAREKPRPAAGWGRRANLDHPCISGSTLFDAYSGALFTGTLAKDGSWYRADSPWSSCITLVSTE